MSFKISHSLLGLILLTTYTCVNIIPDLQNPITIKYPFMNEGGEIITLRFSFSTNSKGLKYGQYLGIVFPTDAFSSSTVFTKDPLGFTCSLKDTNGIIYKVTAVNSLPEPNIANLLEEKNIAYCRFNEKNAFIDVAVANTIYILSIKINDDVTISKQFLNSIGLFTATKNDPTRIVIDSVQIGTAAVYPDKTSTQRKPLTIVSTELTITSGPFINNSTIYKWNNGTITSSNPNFKIYPYTTFDISITLLSGGKIFIYPDDTTIAFSYQSDIVQLPISVFSEEFIFNDSKQPPLLSSNGLTIQVFSNETDTFTIENWTNIIVPNTPFKLLLKGWKSLDNILTSDNKNFENLSANLFYKNSYGFLSSDSMPIFKIDAAAFSCTVNHPEYWDIWRNAAWPFKFIIKSNSDLINGGYLLIQHSNAVLNTNKLNFMPSTCDLSQWSNIDNSFGKRPNCFPIRSDHNFITAGANQPYLSSGFFVKVPSIKANLEYIITIWAFADNCGGNTGYDSTSEASRKINSQKFSFNVSLYKSISSNLMNEQRLTTTPVAYGKATMINTCWNSQVYLGNNPLYFETNALQQGITKSPTGSGNDIMLLKEITDWNIGIQNSSTNCDGGVDSCFSNDISAVFDKKYFTSTPELVDSNFLASAIIKKEGYTSIQEKLANYIPINIGASDKFISGKLIVNLPSKYILPGNKNTCYLSWGLTVDSEEPNPSQSSLLMDKEYDKSQPDPMCNIISGEAGSVHQDLTILSVAEMNKNGSPMRIVSSKYFGQDDLRNKFTFLSDSNNLSDGSQFTIGFFSNCLRWLPLPKVTSLYSAVDIMFQWNYSSNTEDINALGWPSKAIRLIKMFPEGGVWHNLDKTIDYASSGGIITHMAYGNSSTQNAICLIEMNGSTLYKSNLTNNSKTLSIWIMFGVLLESDYSDAASLYPVSPLSKNFVSYGLQSPPMITNENRYYANNADSLLKIIQNSQSANTGYHYLMGSIILINNSGDQNNAITPTVKDSESRSNLLIPFYCPYGSSSISYSNNQVPTVFAAWLNMSSFSDISKVTSHFYSITNDKKNTLIQTPTYPKANLVPKVATENGIIIQFSPYTSEKNNDILYVYNGKVSESKFKANPGITCSGHVLLLKNSIQLGSEILLNGFDSDPVNIYTSLNSKFYAFGKLFNIAINAVTKASQGNFVPGDLTESQSSYYFSGIKRPTLDSLFQLDNISNTPYFQSEDLIAYYCTNSLKFINEYATNLRHIIYDEVTKNTNDYFLLNYNTDSSINLNSFKLENDKNSSDKNIINDPAGNFNTNFDLPFDLPQGLNIIITSKSLTKEAICGLSNSFGDYVNECETETTDDKKVTCSLYKKTRSVSICCYNIKITEDLITLEDLNISVPTNPNIFQLEYHLQSSILIPDTSSYSAVKLSASVGRVKGALISKVTYQHVEQAEGIGKLILTITLPRRPVRDMRISIVGDFSFLFIPNVKSRCEVLFTDNGNDIRLNTDLSTGLYGWDNGDILIDSCIFSNNTNNMIEITTKRMVYKCGLTFSTTLNIVLWPVILPDFSNSPIYMNSYRVLLRSNRSPYVNLSYDLDQFVIPYPFKLASKPKSKFIAEKLCILNSSENEKFQQPFPRIPGEIADYRFDFDFSTLKDYIKGVNANEVTIFFPYEYYGALSSDNENIVCYFNQLLINCSFSDQGILNVRFSQNIQDILNSNFQLQVTVSGIRNPSVDKDIFFPCTVNNADFTTDKRSNLITGTGKLSNGITLRSVQSSSGSLRYLWIQQASSTNFISNLNPRSTSTHMFRISFDYGKGMTQSAQSIVISGNIWLFVNFPSNYSLHRYSVETTTCVIEEYTSDENKIITKSFIHYPKITITGNRIFLLLEYASYTFPINFRYWDIILNNINNPSKNNGVSKARKYSIILTNNNLNSMYRTFDDLDTQNSNIKLGNTADNLITNVRGPIFDYSDIKWVVDLSDYYELSTTNKGKIVLNPGRFKKAAMVIRQPKFKVPPAQTYLTFEKDNTIVIMTSDSVLNNSFLISSSYNLEPIAFYIGVKCQTPSGTYFLSVTNSNVNEFFPTPPFIVVVKNSIPAPIFYKAPENVSIAGSAFVYIFLNEPNVDQLNIQWTYNDLHKNDISSIISTITILVGSITDLNSPYSNIRSYYSIAFPDKIEDQSFKVSDPNSCYKWTKSTISFKIQSKNNYPKNLINLEKFFVYVNSDSDKKNSIKFKFTSYISRVYIYCALTCFNSLYPSDVEIFNLAPAIRGTASPSTQFFSYFHYDSNMTVDILFNNLVRGINYKMRCLLQSDENEILMRNKTSINIEYNGTGTEASRQALQTISLEATKCVKYKFSGGTISDNVKKNLVNYCQSLFSKNGFMSNGCMICTDPNKDFNNPGLRFSQNPLNCSVLNTYTSNSKNIRLGNLSNNTFTVCAVQDRTCPTNLISDIFDDLIRNLTIRTNITDIINGESLKLVSTEIIADNDYIDTSSIQISDLEFNSTGYIKWKNIYTLQKTIICKWLIEKSNTSLYKENVILCNDISRCGITTFDKLDYVSNYKVAAFSELLKPFENNTDYAINYVCYNDVPLPQTFSKVYSATTFNLNSSLRILHDDDL